MTDIPHFFKLIFPKFPKNAVYLILSCGPRLNIKEKTGLTFCLHLGD